MSLELLLIRHGQSEGNRDKTFTGHGPSDLTELGKRQSEAVAMRLLELPVSTVYSSDLPRAMATARPYCDRRGVEAVATRDIRERDMGAFTGLTFTDVSARYPEGWEAIVRKNPEYRPPDGESHRDCARRVGRFTDGLIARGETGAVVLFSHGVAIHHMLSRLLRVPKDASVTFMVDNCSIQRVLVRADGSVKVCNLNDISHLHGLTT